MKLVLSSESLARLCALHPWRTVSIWLLVMVVALAISSQLFDSAITTEDRFIGEPESAVAERLAETRLTGPKKMTESLIVSSDSFTVEEIVFRKFVSSLTV